MTNTQGLADELAVAIARWSPHRFTELKAVHLGDSTIITPAFNADTLAIIDDGAANSEAFADLLVLVFNSLPAILTALRSDALDAKDAEIARVRAETLEEAARVAEGWRSSLCPGTDSRLLGHREAARDIATAIRALAKGGE